MMIYMKSPKTNLARLRVALLAVLRPHRGLAQVVGDALESGSQGAEHLSEVQEGYLQQIIQSESRNETYVFAVGVLDVASCQSKSYFQQ